MESSSNSEPGSSLFAGRLGNLKRRPEGFPLVFVHRARVEGGPGEARAGQE